MELVTVSVAVRVWLPAVLSVKLKVPLPLVKVALAGKHGLAVAAGEVDGAGVVNRVVELIQRGHGEGRGVPAATLVGPVMRK